MIKTLIPVLAGVVLVGTATAQEAKTRIEVRKAPHARIYTQHCFGSGSFLGVHIQDINEEQGRNYGLSEPYGALVNDVVDSSPARAAGLQKEDLIVSWNGARVESAAQLRRLVQETPAGRDVRIGYIRNGVQGELSAKIADRPAPSAIFMDRLPDSLMHFREQFMDKNFREKIEKELEGVRPRIEQFQYFLSGADGRTGMNLQSLSPQLARYFGLGDRSGALVGSVQESSAAEKGGLQAGDVILEIDGEKVTSPMDANRILSAKGEGTVELRLLREKSERTITLELKGPALNHTMPFRMFENFGEPFKMFENFPDMEQEEDIDLKLLDQEGNPEMSRNMLPHEHPAAPHTEIVPLPRHEGTVMNAQPRDL